MEAQILIKRGARWRVGDGRRTNVTGQPWLPSLHNPYITTQHAAFNDITVHNLMFTNSTEWDCGVIEDLFNIHDKQLIYSIQLAKNCCIDSWFWAHELNGIYTVKSAYKLAQNLLRPWDENNNGCIWKSLWRVKVPAKFKTFLWRALANCLPTLSNLQTKRIHVSVTCPLCGLEEETIDHCLIHCIFARTCWNIVCPEFLYDSTMIFRNGCIIL